MTDLQSLITEASQYGELRKVREYMDWTCFVTVHPDDGDYDLTVTYTPKHLADAMRDELLALVIKQGRMLDEAARESWEDGTFKELEQAMPDGYRDFYLADLARRAEDSREEET